jgi:4-hydroxy-tetrahydrodipicolinate synthase
MNDLRELLRGLWLPLVTPFRDGELDETSLRRLVRHYASLPVDGLILAATSGEGMSLGMSELERLVAMREPRFPQAAATSLICLGLRRKHAQDARCGRDRRLGDRRLS